VNSQRAQAYGQAIKLVDDLSASKLHQHEQDVVRGAADALFFCENIDGDPTAEQALADFYDLMDRMTENDRLLPETASRLTADIEACGPMTPVAA
jgi:hypothetical protein